MPVPNYDRTTVAACTVFSTSNVGYSATTNLGNKKVAHDILTVSSVQTPGFRYLERWALPRNPYQKLYYRLTDPRGTVTTTRRMFSPAPTGTAQYYDRIVAPLNHHTLLADPDQTSYQLGTIADDPYPLAVARLQKQITDGNAQTGVFLGEAAKTGAHLAHTATRVYNALKALKKCRFGEFTSALGITATQRQTRRYYSGVRVNHGQQGSGFKFDSKSKFSREEQKSRFSDFAAQTWLEFTYGWKPLLKDIHEHAVALEKVANTFGLVMRTAIATAKTEKTTNVNFLSGGGDYLRINKHVESVRRMRICVDFKLPTGVMGAANTFGLTDPLSVAWEVVPFSFIVDWFYPIGKYLEGISSYNGLVFHRGYKTGSHKYFAKNTTSTGPFKPNWAGDSTLTIDSTDLWNQLDSFSFGRDILISFPSTPFPQFKDPRSISHGISAVALLKTLFIPSPTGKLRL